MRTENNTKVKYSSIIIPCQKCGRRCEVSLGYSEAEEVSSSSSEPDTEVKPPLKKPKLSASETSSSSSEDSDSDTTSSTTRFKSSNRPQIPAAHNSYPSSSELIPSSDSESFSSSSPSSDSGDDMLPMPLKDSSVRQFFDQFSPFTYDSSQPVMSEYFRMTQSLDFKSLSQAQKRQAQKDLKNALAKDFGRLYGDDVDDLGAWQSLCRVLRFEDVPDDLEGCQQLIKATYVNIVDLIDTVNTGDPVQHFNSEKVSIGNQTTQRELRVSTDMQTAVGRTWTPWIRGTSRQMNYFRILSQFAYRALATSTLVIHTAA
ncbi:unnamed protein product [Rhizoctonia solani]|uniref:Uncharacterized protein n=1 Tax=Rhizoctonia solani TaxID=456999 RepID=A0A8H3BXL5_9AGAM|nr:unnamed protein product [Rhizoctonia solani]